MPACRVFVASAGSAEERGNHERKPPKPTSKQLPRGRNVRSFVPPVAGRLFSPHHMNRSAYRTLSSTWAVLLCTLATGFVLPWTPTVARPGITSPSEPSSTSPFFASRRPFGRASGAKAATAAVGVTMSGSVGGDQHIPLVSMIALIVSGYELPEVCCSMLHFMCIATTISRGWSKKNERVQSSEQPWESHTCSPPAAYDRCYHLRQRTVSTSPPSCAPIPSALNLRLLTAAIMALFLRITLRVVDMSCSTAAQGQESPDWPSLCMHH